MKVHDRMYVFLSSEHMGTILRLDFASKYGHGPEEPGRDTAKGEILDP